MAQSTDSMDWTRETPNNETLLDEDDDYEEALRDWQDAAEEEPDFFSIYFSTARFASETALALASAALNLIALMTLVNQYLARPTTKAVYRCLFMNLALANLLISLVQWFCNNILYFFDDQLMAMLNQGRYCTFFVYLTAAFFAASSLGMISALTMLGFAAYQYFAICKPLRNIAVVSTTRVTAFLAVSWVASFVCCCLPFVVLLLMAEYASECDEWLLQTIQNSTVIGVNASVSVVGAIYLVVILICLRIYLEVRRLQRRLLQFSLDQNLKHERKAFVTTVILLATLTFFFLPHTVIYAFTFNGSSDHLLRSSPLVHYMNLLPYLKFLTDPLIYGLRLLRPASSGGRGRGGGRDGSGGGGGCCGRRRRGAGASGGGGGGRRRSWHICGEPGSSSNDLASTTAASGCQSSASFLHQQRRRSFASRHTSVCTTTTYGVVQLQMNEAAAAATAGPDTPTPV